MFTYYIYIYNLGTHKPQFEFAFVNALMIISKAGTTQIRTVVSLTQGEDHKVWGNAPKKSNSATCAHCYKRARYASKPNIFLLLQNFRGVKIVIFHDFC